LNKQADTTVLHSLIKMSIRVSTNLYIGQVEEE